MSVRVKNLLGLVALFVAATPLIWYLTGGAGWRWWRNAEVGDFVAEAASSAYFSPLDGGRVKNKPDRMRQVVAIMIDNHPDARPESALSQAKIVYEAPVEGNFTRYMALFDSDQKVAQAGPVRSARLYFLDWVQEYGQPLYMHSGGSPEALQQIKQRKILDADEFTNGQYYWRNDAQVAPHNLYTSSNLWQALLTKFGITKTWDPNNSWKFAQVVGQPFRSTITKEVSLPYAADYIVTWKFDSKKLDYVRYLNGEQQFDSNGKEIRAFNVLIQFVITKVLDDEGRLQLTTIGKGDARILKKGQMLVGTWNKKELEGRTRFYTKDGKEALLLPGKTWVEVVPAVLMPQITQ